MLNWGAGGVPTGWLQHARLVAVNRWPRSRDSSPAPAVGTTQCLFTVHAKRHRQCIPRAEGESVLKRNVKPGSTESTENFEQIHALGRQTRRARQKHRNKVEILCFVCRFFLIGFDIEQSSSVQQPFVCMFSVLTNCMINQQACLDFLHHWSLALPTGHLRWARVAVSRAHGTGSLLGSVDGRAARHPLPPPAVR